MRIKEYNKFVIILGFKDVKINNINEFLEKIRIETSPIVVQLFEADNVAGRPHLFFAALNAIKAFEQGRNISEKLEIEILLYASGKRQINKAIKMLGIKPKTSNVAIVMIASNNVGLKEVEKTAEKYIPGIRDDSVLAMEGEEKVMGLMETFGITNLELETMMDKDVDKRIVLMWLIIEHSALIMIKH